MRLVYDNDALKKWAGELSGPVVIYDNELPRTGWAEILMLAERLAPEPALLPSDPLEHSRVVTLSRPVLQPGRPRLDAAAASGARDLSEAGWFPGTGRRLPRKEIRLHA